MSSGFGCCACVPWRSGHPGAFLYYSDLARTIWPIAWLSAPVRQSTARVPKKWDASREYATSFLFRVCRIPTSVLWHYSVIFGNTMKWKVQIDRKRKKDPGVAIFSPRVFETGAVRRGKSLTMRLTNFYDATFQKGHQLAVIGTGGGRRTSESAELRRTKTERLLFAMR